MAKVDFADANMAGVLALSAELRTLRSRLAPAMRAPTVKSAANIRQDARNRWRALSSGKTTRRYPNTITSEITVSNATLVMAEIGPEGGKRTQGSFGHIFEFGTSRTAPKPHVVPAWEAEIDAYADALGLSVQRVVLP